MVKLKIHKQDEDNDEQELTLAFHQDSSGTINITTIDKNASYGWFIVGITTCGNLVRFRSVPEDIGLNVDSEGRIKDIDEHDIEGDC